MAIAEKLFPGADPFILNHGGRYYLYCTTEIPIPARARSAQKYLSVAFVRAVDMPVVTVTRFERDVRRRT